MNLTRRTKAPVRGTLTGAAAAACAVCCAAPLLGLAGVALTGLAATAAALAFAGLVFAAVIAIATVAATGTVANRRRKTTPDPSVLVDPAAHVWLGPISPHDSAATRPPGASL